MIAQLALPDSSLIFSLFLFFLLYDYMHLRHALYGGKNRCNFIYLYHYLLFVAGYSVFVVSSLLFVVVRYIYQQ